MTKIVMTVAVATMLCMSEAAAYSIVQKSDWQAKAFETYLPPPANSAPWLEIDVRTKPRKQDVPLGWFANALQPFVLHSISPETRMAAGIASDLRRM